MIGSYWHMQALREEMKASAHAYRMLSRAREYPDGSDKHAEYIDAAKRALDRCRQHHEARRYFETANDDERVHWNDGIPQYEPRTEIIPIDDVPARVKQLKRFGCNVDDIRPRNNGNAEILYHRRIDTHGQGQ